MFDKSMKNLMIRFLSSSFLHDFDYNARTLLSESNPYTTHVSPFEWFVEKKKDEDIVGACKNR